MNPETGGLVSYNGVSWFLITKVANSIHPKTKQPLMQIWGHQLDFLSSGEALIFNGLPKDFAHYTYKAPGNDTE